MRKKTIYAALVAVWTGYIVWEIVNNSASPAVKGPGVRMDVILIPSLLLLITAFLVYQLFIDKDQ